MEQERLAKEAEEREKAEREKKIKDAFDDTNTQWAKDKSEMQDIAKEANKGAQDSKAPNADSKVPIADSKVPNADSKDASSNEKSNAANAAPKDAKQQGLADA